MQLAHDAHPEERAAARGLIINKATEELETVGLRWILRLEPGGSNAASAAPTSAQRNKAVMVVIDIDLLGCSLPSHGHSHIGFIFSFPFFDS
jgi:hypothetical protein